MNGLLRKLSFSHWNIGFLNLGEEELIARKSLGEPVWLKHDFKDRFFADPFFLSTDGKTAKVLAEELIFSEYKGRIVCLTCDTETGALLERKVVLELPAHLSYPQIIREDSKVYLIPENAESGAVNAFLYDEQTDTATFCQKLIDEPLVDATFFSHRGKWWCFADHVLKNCDKELFLYSSDKLLGPYVEAHGSPFFNDIRFGRTGGAIFSVGRKIFRPAQNSLNGYGTGLEIREVVELSLERGLVEQIAASLPPFGDGLHTINFLNGKCVVDGNRLQFAPVRKILAVYGHALRNKLGK